MFRIFPLLHKMLIFDEYTKHRLVAIMFLTMVFNTIPFAFALSTGRELIGLSKMTPIDFVASGENKEIIEQFLSETVGTPHSNTSFLLGATFGLSILGGTTSSWRLQLINSNESIFQDQTPIISILQDVSITTLETHFHWLNISTVSPIVAFNKSELFITVDNTTLISLNLQIGDSFYIYSNVTNRQVLVRITESIQVSRNDNSIQILARDSEDNKIGNIPWLLFGLNEFTALATYLNNATITEFSTNVTMNEQLEFINRLYVFVDREVYFNPLQLSQTIQRYKTIQQDYEEFFSFDQNGISWLDFGITFSYRLFSQQKATSLVIALGIIIFSPVLIIGLYLTALWINLTNPSLNSRLLWLKSRGLRRHQTATLLIVELSVISVIAAIIGLFGGLVLAFGISASLESFSAYSGYLGSVIPSYLLQSLIASFLGSGWIFINTFSHVESNSSLNNLRIRSSRYLQETTTQQREIGLKGKGILVILSLWVGSVMNIEYWIGQIPVIALLLPFITIIFSFFRFLSPLFFVLTIFIVVYFLSAKSHHIFNIILRTLNKFSISTGTIIAFMFSTSTNHLKRTILLLSITFTILFSLMITSQSYQVFLLEDAELYSGSDLWVTAIDPYALTLHDKPLLIIDDIYDFLETSKEVEFFTPVFIIGASLSFKRQVEITIENIGKLSTGSYDIIFLNLSNYVSLLNPTAYNYIENSEKHSEALMRQEKDILIWLNGKSHISSVPRLDDKIHTLTFNHSFSELSHYNTTRKNTLYTFNYLPGINELLIGRPTLIIPFSFSGNFSTILNVLDSNGYSFKTRFFAKFAKDLQPNQKTDFLRRLKNLYPTTIVSDTRSEIELLFTSSNEISFLFQIFNNQIVLIAVLLMIILGFEMFFDIRFRSHEYAMLVTRGAKKSKMVIGLIIEVQFILILSLLMSIFFSFILSSHMLALLPAYFTFNLLPNNTLVRNLIYPESLILFILSSLSFSIIAVLLVIYRLNRLHLVETLRQFGD